jgi:hypothetical protein
MKKYPYHFPNLKIKITILKWKNIDQILTIIQKS